MFSSFDLKSRNKFPIDQNNSGVPRARGSQSGRVESVK